MYEYSGEDARHRVILNVERRDIMKWVLIDERMSKEMERTLAKHGIYTIRLPRASSLPDAICAHPDTLIFKCKNVLMSSCEYAEEALHIFSDIREISGDLQLRFCDESFGKSYPQDAILNAKVIGNYLFANTKNISCSILEVAKKSGLRVKNVNQGYTNCAILCIDNESAITADRGLYQSLSDCNINALLISHGHIELPPYEYGFIGGACGVIGDTVFFFGNLDRHPDTGSIRKFIEERGKKCVSLSDEPLTDLGGFVEI